MQLTPNYNLKKPEGTDPVDIQDFNDNADILDAELNKKADSTGGDISNMTIKALEEPAGTQFPVPEAGETSKSFLGKIRKFMNDFKSWNTGVCMIGQIVNNCVTNNDKLPLSAAQGKVLMDLYSVLNNNFDDRSGVTDLFAVADIGLNARRMVRYNANTLNSPFKAGLTGTIDSGLAIITMGSSGNYGTILCIPEGGIYTSSCVCKKTMVWGDWEQLITAPNIQAGSVNKSVPASSLIDIPIVFKTPFSTVPVVVVSLNGRPSAITAWCYCYAHSITSTGFSIRITNVWTGESNPAVNWFACPK